MITGFAGRYSGSRNPLWRVLAVVGMLGLVFAPLPVVGQDASAKDASDESVDLTDMSIEDLMNVEIEVTSVSKKAEKLSDTTAAVYVITAEDIRRSGATTLAEALRMAPGLHVASINANNWLIGSRGFSDRFANKVLVLVDGRSIYSPGISGVWWDAQDIMLERVDRIEVIRGPGATTWGTNAVNGLINVITKSAKKSQENLIAQSFGEEEKSVSSVQTAGRVNGDTYYTAYAKSADRAPSFDGAGGRARDDWSQSRVEFRLDSDRADGDSFSLLGQVHEGEGWQSLYQPQLAPPYSLRVDDNYRMSGGSLQARWSMSRSDRARAFLQVYYDRMVRDDGRFGETGDTWDVDYQEELERGKHELVWGLGCRYISDRIRNSEAYVFTVPDDSSTLVSAFLQDGIRLSGDRLRLTVGSKFEDNKHTGLEAQPSARLLWTMGDGHTAWAAISRAVRTPCRYELHGAVVLGVLPGTPDTGGLPQEIVLTGNPDLDSEKLTAYELGYRFSASKRLSLDVSAFYNKYDQFRSFEMDVPQVVMTPAPHLSVPLRLNNGMNASSRGIELAATYQVSDRWKLSAAYSSLGIRMWPDSSSTDTISGQYGALSPRTQYNIRSYLDIGGNLEFDTMLYYVDGLRSPTIVTAGSDVPAYTRVDFRLGWHASPDLTYSLVLQNAFDSAHPEYNISVMEVATEIERSLYGRLTWRF